MEEQEQPKCEHMDIETGDSCGKCEFCNSFRLSGKETKPAEETNEQE